MRMKLVELTVPPPGAGQQMDRWLAKARIGLSRNRLRALLEARGVLVNSKPARQSLKLKKATPCASRCRRAVRRA